jgi:iron complex outermembrane receptor protein
MNTYHPAGWLRHCARACAALVVTALLFIGAPLSAQNTPTGSIEGRVQNLVTGDYLNNARVSIKGTNLVSLTDDAGRYRLKGVTAGTATLRVFFTGLDEQEIPVVVTAGQTIERDVSLTSKALYGEEIVTLGEFVVQSTKETNAAAIAVNEQRFSQNQKSVVSADQFGTIPDSNPGELMKWLPGVSVEYFANNIVGVSVRGLDSANTEITFDGMPVASAQSSTSGRGFEMKSASASDIARVEVRKLPLPEDSSNALGGSINLVRRSAFEYSKRKVEYRALFTSDIEDFGFSERDGPRDQKVQYWRPNWRISWTEPVSKKFGFAVTVGHDDVIANVHWSSPAWDFGNAAAATAAEARLAAGLPLTTPSVYNPARTQDLIHNNPIQDIKDYATLKLDWRPFPDLKFSYAISGSRYTNKTGDEMRYIWRTGTPLSNTRGNTYGSIGNGNIEYDMREAWRNTENPTLTNQIEAEWKKNAWTFTVRGSYSGTKHSFKDMEEGFFGSTTMPGSSLLNTGIGVGRANPRRITVNLLDQTLDFSQRIEAFDAVTGAPIDWSDPANMYIGGAVSRPAESKESIAALRLFTKYQFNFENPLSVRAGFDYDEQYRNVRRYDANLWTFVGPDHIAQTADDHAGQIRATTVKPSRDYVYNAPAAERINLASLYSLYVAHPDWFAYRDAESHRFSVADPKELSEKTTAGYIEFFGNFLSNRLGYAGGVRYEKSEAWGLGSLDRGAVSQVGLTGLAAAQARYIRKGARGEGENEGYFPSLHLNYNLTDNFIFRVGYAKTQAKNRFDRTVIPSTSVVAISNTSPFATVASGQLNVRNPDLKPWTANNYEAHLEYYTKQGGVFSAGVYRKNIKDYQVSKFALLDTPAALAEWGFGPEFTNFQVSTFLNDGVARLDGAEFEMRQPLNAILPNWARGFEFTGSFNYNDLRKRPGDNISVDFSNFYETQHKGSLSFRRDKFRAMVGLIRNGKVYRQRDDAAGHAGFRYYPAYTTADASIEYSITRWTTLFVSARNLTNALKRRIRVVDGAPEWSQLHIENSLGLTATAGITGSF